MALIICVEASEDTNNSQTKHTNNSQTQQTTVKHNTQTTVKHNTQTLAMQREEQTKRWRQGVTCCNNEVEPFAQYSSFLN